MPEIKTDFLEVFSLTDVPAGSGQSHAEHRLAQGNDAVSLFRKIVIPLGLVSDPGPILGQVAGLTARFRSEILLLQLFPHTCQALRDPGEVAHLRGSLSKTAHQFVQAGAARVYAALLEGNVSYHIEETARQHNASLILIAEERDESDSQPWFGTVTQRLSRRSRVPLLVVKPGASLAMSPILCAVDFSESSRVAIGHALELARTLSARLLIQHVVPEPCMKLNESSLWRTVAAPSVDRERINAQPVSPMQKAEVDRKIHAAREELTRFTAEFDLSGVDYDTRVVCGSLVAETIFTARAKRAGVVVMGSSRRSGLTTVESQTPAETVAEIADIPILISHHTSPARPLKNDASTFARKTR